MEQEIKLVFTTRIEKKSNETRNRLLPTKAQFFTNRISNSWNELPDDTVMSVEKLKIKLDKSNKDYKD